ncbi:hypothetical protein DFH27DRAFT_531285 [Peziza echinospora]|nr:hypothetical protein DFH27DRAFT_531285 [Peziza echinospora]
MLHVQARYLTDGPTCTCTFPSGKKILSPPPHPCPTPNSTYMFCVYRYSCLEGGLLCFFCFLCFFLLFLRISAGNCFHITNLFPWGRLLFHAFLHFNHPFFFFFPFPFFMSSLLNYLSNETFFFLRLDLFMDGWELGMQEISRCSTSGSHM